MRNKVNFPYPNHYEFDRVVGLTDKNGQDIYERDIIKNILGEFSEVHYGIQSCNCCHGSYGFGTDNNDILTNEYIEIIGNIHENIEFLKRSTNN